MAVIKIFTGAIRSGKTTRLMNWASSQKNIDGIFQPVVENKRFIYHIGDRTLKLLEATDLTPPKSIVEIGKYKFNQDIFDWAGNALLKSFTKDLDWLVVDEVGQLELDGKGLGSVISEILDNRHNFNGSIIFVVRDSLLEKFTDKFNHNNSFETMEIE